jgi:hypothetical protein
MKRLMQWVMAAALICSSTLFTSCMNDDNPVGPTDNLAEKLIGKWMDAYKDGQPATTNKKMVITFVSPTKAYICASLNVLHGVSTAWFDHIEADVAIDGDKVTVTSHPDEHKTLVHEYVIINIDGSQFKANHKVTSTVDGEVDFFKEDVVCYAKIKVDYSEAILGLWECKGLKGGETYNDGNDRLEFLSDGTYRFYHKDDAGQWQAVTTREFQDYFVDGTLLATRWKNIEENELREWWEIKSLKGDKMQWKALRQNEDGSTFEQTMDWERVVE